MGDGDETTYGKVAKLFHEMEELLFIRHMQSQDERKKMDHQRDVY